MVDTRVRGKGWYNGSSFSLLWLGGGMHSEGMEKALVAPSWGRDVSAQIWITLHPCAWSERSFSWQL